MSNGQIKQYPEKINLYAAAAAMSAQLRRCDPPIDPFAIELLDACVGATAAADPAVGIWYLAEMVLAAIRSHQARVDEARRWRGISPLRDDEPAAPVIDPFLHSIRGE